ncbi:DNA-binding transcriptional regulator, LysR family [Roseomonas rosea]|uniref:DNA-binding transcriptional regulator, LysR family n=1 Tax=Muricoccus roseus TaxID=198092 RepID=A0A1M6KZB0_9PROT|nr:LysR family transcriptional regulator [Roseomonas rosea]SHJ64259.1 DNA-binding transcriptional regulator, LysR family [Roseomonas rosea]
MDTRFLETFLAVVENGSVAGAARRLNLTPAGVAQRLRALEAEIGAPLLARAGRSLVPTGAGARIAQRAPALLDGLRDLAALATEDALAGELRLGAVPTAITGLLPDLMMSLRDRHPRIETRIVPGRSEELYGRVADGALDAALIVQPPFEIPKTCGWTALREEPLIVLVPRRLAGADPLAVLSAEPFIRYDSASWGGKLAGAYLRQRRIRPREGVELVTLDAIAVLVDRGLGVSLVPDWAPPWPEGLSLARLPLPDAPARRMGLVWGRASPRLRLVQALLGGAAARV